MQTVLNEMIERAARYAESAANIIPRVQIRVRNHPTNFAASLYSPTLCLVLQGAKQVKIGDQLLRYDPASYFISSLDLAGSGRIVQASPAQPFITLNLALNIENLATLLPSLPPRQDCPAPGFGTAPVTTELLEPWCRLLRLLDTPEDAPVLAPLFELEILYRLLRGPHGVALRQLAHTGSRLSQIRRAIGWIRSHYDQPLKVDELAGMAGMSVASLHRHFKVATGTSPLRYQKSLRLQQARLELLASEDATRAGYSVGYESLSQFSREYARMFGQPPLRDARRLLRADEASLLH